MDYNARNKPYLNRLSKTVAQNANRSLQITNNLTPCNANNIVTPSGPNTTSSLCNFMVDYVSENHLVKVQVINTTNNIIERVYYIQPNVPGVISVSPVEKVVISTEFPLYPCYYTDPSDKSICPTTPQTPQNYSWDVSYANLVDAVILQFEVSGSLCCYNYSSNTVITCDGDFCASLTPSSGITGTFIYPNQSRKIVAASLIK